MSSRQKSFFDKDHGRKSTHWQRNRPGNHEGRAQAANTGAATEGHAKAPIAASNEAKSKLGAFSFHQQSSHTSSNQSPGKENTCSPSRRDASEMKVMAAALGEALPPPSTPAVRLPLADLLGHNDDVRRRGMEKEASPEEQLSWMPDDSRHAETPALGRKRANSSSPGTSSQADNLSARKALQLQTMQRTMATPKADPAADLWTSYKSGIDDSDNTFAKIPSLSHLLQDSSPKQRNRSPTGSVGGLRRWASCGNEWPVEKTKRRKVQGAFRQESTLPAPKPLAEITNVSRLGSMVDQIQAKLVKDISNRAGSEPSSTSPLPEKNSFSHAAFDRIADITPLHRAASVARTEQSPRRGPQQASDSGNGQESNGDSDYGDDNLDLAALADSEQSPERDYETEETAAGARQRGTREFAGASRIDRLAAIQENSEDFDEFDDGNDLTVEDLEVAMTQMPALQASDPAPIQKPETSRLDEITHARRTASPEQCRVAGKVMTISDDEDFGGLDLDEGEMQAAELAATQACASGKPSHNLATKSRKIQRYLVKSVEAGHYTDAHGRQCEEKVLLVEEDKTRLLKAITIRQSWLDTHCTPGSFVHVVGKFSRTGQITIDDAKHLLIVHPDHLVSATAVADSFDCLRKAVLQDRVKATNMTSKATVYGTVLHELFQIAMQQNQWDLDFLDATISGLVTKHIEGLFEAGAQNTNEAMETLTAKMPELRAWAQDYVRSTPDLSIKARCRNGKTVNMAVTKLLDVEEHVWSPTYGLKGNIDATVEVTMEDEQGSRKLTVPFEVKTGKFQSPAHQAQTALYTLLLSDRYDVDVQYGILYYMDNSVTHRVPAVRHELRHMVMQRNELASFVRERLSLPPMLKDERKCGRCYAKTSCFLYHKLSEDGNPDTAGVGNKFAEVVSKLKPAHQEFFKRWDHLLTKEETEMFKFKRELWTMLSTEREKVGRCFSEVIIEPGSAHEDYDAQKINRFGYTLVKRKPTTGFSFTESQLVVGEPIVISSEQGHFALANGYVVKVSPSRITVAVDRRLHNARIRQPGFDELDNQSFAAIMEVGKHREAGGFVTTESQQAVYRLDKDEFSNGMATVRNNLLAIMDDALYRSFDLRQLLIEDTPPKFKNVPTAYSLTGPASQMQINSDQRSAIDKIMSAEDYALVLGMPGTGKTTTIAHIIRALVAQGKSVLLTSYTHTAVDNILLKLKDSSISVLRLGALAKIDRDVQSFAQLAAVPPQTIEELEEMYLTPQVVATTCLGINHQIFLRRIFDYCIVDEASQITLPVCIGPVRMARTFVLVGDHYQLPPLVQNKEAQEGGLDISLFKLLSDRQPSSMVNLEHQYRMCSEIMHLSNTLIYSGRLKCGNDAVALRTLHVPQPDGLARFHSSAEIATRMTPSQQLHQCPSASSVQCLLRDILSPARKVVFLNTDGLASASEALSGSRITNSTEASILHLLSSALLAQGVASSQLGIITFYRSQLALLRQTLRHGYADTSNIEMHTADKFQGRDKEVVLLSCVRSNKDGNVGELLRDWRRVNVAITRARSKFVIVGSKRTLQGDELWRKLIRAVEDVGRVIDVGPGLLDGHVLDRGTSTGSLSGLGVTRSPEQKDTRGLRDAKDGGNRGQVRKAPKQGRIGKELLFRRGMVTQDVLNMLVQ